MEPPTDRRSAGAECHDRPSGGRQEIAPLPGKPLDDRTVGKLSLELAMFMRWWKEMRREELPVEWAREVAQCLLRHARFPFDEPDCRALLVLAVTYSDHRIDQLRRRLKFDDSVAAFCQRLGIPLPECL
jgi:hypothetical protein